MHFLLGVVMALQEYKHHHGYISVVFANPGLEVMQSTKLPRKLGTLIHFYISGYVNSMLAFYTH